MSMTISATKAPPSGTSVAPENLPEGGAKFSISLPK